LPARNAHAAHAALTLVHAFRGEDTAGGIFFFVLKSIKKADRVDAALQARPPRPERDEQRSSHSLEQCILLTATRSLLSAQTARAHTEQRSRSPRSG
jgi:hypothetical protein